MKRNLIDLTHTIAHNFYSNEKPITYVIPIFGINLSALTEINDFRPGKKNQQKNLIY